MSQLINLSTSTSLHGPDVTVVLLFISLVKCHSTHKATPLHDPDLKIISLSDDGNFHLYKINVTLQIYVPLLFSLFPRTSQSQFLEFLVVFPMLCMDIPKVVVAQLLNLLDLLISVRKKIINVVIRIVLLLQLQSRSCS